MSRRTMFLCGFLTVLAVALLFALPPREAASRNVVDPTLAFDGKAGDNPKSLAKGEFQATGSYTVPAGATRVSVAVKIMVTYTKATNGGGAAFGIHEATLDEAKKTWSIKVGRQTEGHILYVTARVEYFLDGSTSSMDLKELRIVEIMN